MIIKVCIGSACHIKGSYEVIENFKKLIKKHGLDESVELKSSFCLGSCGTAVSVMVDEGDIVSLSPETVERFFKEQVLGVIK